MFPPKKGTVRNHAMFIVDCPFGFKVCHLLAPIQRVHPFLAKRLL